MWRSYFTIAVRALAKDRQFAAINILGLAVGMAACLLILLYVRNERSFDAWLPNAGNIYQLKAELHNQNQSVQYWSSVPGPAMAALIKDFPEVEEGVRFTYDENAVRVGDRLEQEKTVYTDPTLFKVLPFPVAAGDGDATIRKPTGAIVSREFAKRRFGTDDVVGKSILVTVNGAARRYDIGAVLQDLPSNTQFEFNIILPIKIEDYKDKFWVLQHWGGYNVDTFVRVKPGVDVNPVRAQLRAWAKRNDTESLEGPFESPFFPHLINIRDAHTFWPIFRGGAVDPVDPRLVWVMNVIAWLILGISAVNYINLATARVAKRAKEVGIRKALGASQGQLMTQFLLESVVISLIAAMVALAIVELTLPGFNAWLDQRLVLHYFGLEGALPTLLLLVIGVGLAAGFYPALVLARLQPRAVLGARAFTGGTGSELLRRGLVIAQFAVSTGLIICMSVVYAQIVHLRTIEPGYRPSGLIDVTGIGNAELKDKQEAILRAIKAVPGVVNATRTLYSPASQGNNNNGIIPQGKTEKDMIILRSESIDPYYLDTYGVRILAGRNLSDKIANDSLIGKTGSEFAEAGRELNVLINRSALPYFGAHTPTEAIGISFQQPTRSGKLLTSRIVGVIDDFNIRTARDPVNAAYYYYGEPFELITARFEGVSPAVIRERLETAWRQLAPQTPFKAELLTVNIAKFYEADQRRGNAFALFAAIAVALCCLGLYGLAAFVAERRTKEIGIRKVLGARTRDIVRLLAWQFAKPVLWANLIAWPVAWWLMRDWLNGFATRIDLNPLWFVAAALAALAIAFATVAGQALRVARAKPVLALRYE